MPRKAPPTSSMYPQLHNDVAQLLAEDNLHFTFKSSTDSPKHIQSYSTSIAGRFTCRNGKCKNDGWSSGKITIVIRMYPSAAYNATVYHQRCKQCNALSKPKLDGTYAERVSYRLKKWSGVDVEQPDYGGRSDKPHETDLCEGCKAGHCQLGKTFVSFD